MRDHGRWLATVAALMAGAWGVSACGDDTSDAGGGGQSTGDGGQGAVTATTGITSSTSSGMIGDAGIGARCDGDGDCGGDLTCLGVDDDDAFFAGGPGNGYCTRPCESDDDCPTPDSQLPLGECVGSGADKHCAEACIIGDPEMEFLDSELDESKCHGREDVRCQTVNNEDICIPTCRSDDDCGDRSCDPRAAVCVDRPNTGLPTGDACDQDDNLCAGVCVNFTGGEITMCSTRCVLGGPEVDAECGGLTEGICVFSPSGHELGDAAFCTESCSVHSDCQNPTFWCRGVGGITPDVVPNGFCFIEADCPNGNTDCMIDGNVCTDTAFGPKCLDPQFELGGQGGGGEGGGGGAAGRRRGGRSRRRRWRRR